MLSDQKGVNPSALVDCPRSSAEEFDDQGPLMVQENRRDVLKTKIINRGQCRFRPKAYPSLEVQVIRVQIICVGYGT